MTAVTTMAATVAIVSQQVTPVALAGTRPASARNAPGCATVAEDGPELSAVALVEAMDGSERSLLLRHLATAYPDVVEAGAAWLTERRAEAAERRRKANNRSGTLRSRARRRQA